MKLTNIQINELKALIDRAFKRLYADDINLIQRQVHERAVVFRFGIYFYELLRDSSFKDLDLDVEYNRNFNNPKLLDDRPFGVFPDLILHKRESNENNALVLEFKGWWANNNRGADPIKILAFTSQNDRNPYKYGLGGVVLLTLDRAHIEYYLDYESEL